jgi:histidinol-phosphate phosphatase family protein
VTRWEEFHVLPGVPEALRRLNEAGMRVIVVSNQRGIALGLYTAADVEAIHADFQRQLNGAGARIDAFFICPHDKGQCNCRKPLPGLFEQAVATFPDITAATSVIIGDSLSDIVRSPPGYGYGFHRRRSAAAQIRRRRGREDGGLALRFAARCCGRAAGGTLTACSGLQYPFSSTMALRIVSG